MPIKRRRDPSDLGLIVGADRNDTGNAWTAFADRASLIDSERLELSDRFKKCAAFDVHGAAGHRRQTRNNLAFLHRHGFAGEGRRATHYCAVQRNSR